MFFIKRYHCNNHQQGFVLDWRAGFKTLNEGDNVTVYLSLLPILNNIVYDKTRPWGKEPLKKGGPSAAKVVGQGVFGRNG